MSASDDGKSEYQRKLKSGMDMKNRTRILNMPPSYVVTLKLGLVEFLIIPFISKHIPLF